MHSRSFRATRLSASAITILFALVVSAGSAIAATNQGLVTGIPSGGGGSSASPTQRLLAGVGMTAGPWATNAGQTLLGGGVAVLAVLSDSSHLFDGGTPGVTINPSSGLTTTEVGGTASFSAVLTGAPTANVTITLASSDTTEGTVSPTALTFTPANWSQPQTALVTGVADNAIDGSVAFTIITNATSTDSRYQGIAVIDVAVTNLDKASQAITFGAAPAVVVAGTGTLTATGGGSGNPVTFSSRTTGVCTTSGTNGSIVTGVTAGTCTVAADQAGNANYNAAARLTQTFSIGKANQTLTFGAAPTIVVGGTGSVTATGGGSGNPVIFTSQTTGVCTTSGTNGTIVTGVAVGTCTIAANQAGNADYNAAAQVTQSSPITQPNAWLRAATPTVRIGTAFALDLRLNSGGLKVGAYTLRITFDPSRLQIDTTLGDQGVSRGSAGIATNIVNTNNGTGVIQLTGFDLTGSGPGADLQFLVVHFTARQVTGATDIGLQVTTLADPTGQSIGTVARGARLEIIDVLCGDANGDNQLSIIDALWVARQVAGLAPSPFEPLGADVTGDGQVSIIDALMIARRVAGLSVAGGCLAAAPSSMSIGVMTTLASTAADGLAAAPDAPGGGMVSLTPPSSRVESGVQLVLAVQVDSGSARVGAYTLEVEFDPTRLQVDTAAGADQGVSPGAAGLATNIINVDNIQGRMVVTGFDVSGKGPGASLHLLSLYLRSIGSTDGTVPVSLTVRTLADELGQTIGTPSGQGSEVTISDNCPLVSNPDQTDTDGDRLGDTCDPDDDNDSVPDAEDAFPFDPQEQVDTDGDGIGNNADPDDDNDGVPDAEDAFPFDPQEQVDTDGDGIGNHADLDDDRDGVPDASDNCPLAANPDQADADRDGIGDLCDALPQFCSECLPGRGGWRAILR